MDSLLLTLQAGPCEDKIATLQKMLELSTAPDAALKLFLTGALDEYISALDKQLSFAQKDLLILILMELLTSGNEATVEVRQNALEVLRNFSRSKENRQKLFNTPGFVDMLLEISRNEPYMCVKTFALGTLNNLAITDEMAFEILQQKPIIAEVLIECANDDKSNEDVKEKAIKTLMNLAASKHNQAVLVHMANVVDALMHHTVRGSSMKICERAGKALSNLATLQTNRVSLFDKPGFVDMLMECTRTTESVVLKQIVLQTLFLLADNQANKVRMFQRPQLVEILVNCIKTGETSTAGVKEWAIVTLIVLTSVEQHKVILFQRPGVIETLLECTQTKNQDMAKIKEWSLGAFMVLASADANRLPLFERTEVIAAIVDCICSKEDTDAMKEHAIGALYNLATESVIASKLYQNRPLLFALVDKVTAKEEVVTKVKGRATDLLNKLGCPTSRAFHFNTMVTLNSLWDIQRLNRGSHLRTLDRALLHLVGETLCPSM